LDEAVDHRNGGDIVVEYLSPSPERLADLDGDGDLAVPQDLLGDAWVDVECCQKRPA
jgi:hypothetical protein